MSRLSWAVLALLLGATLVGAATFDRRRWPAMLGDEATYLMQAQSLAHDRDLRYERGDYERFVATWERPPDGLILQRGANGRLVYAKPVFYALAVAPFVALAPGRGAAIANALLLATAGLVAARVLARRLGKAAPLWVAAWLFASVVFAQVYWAHSDLFLMALVALALALAVAAADRERGGWRWLAAGLLAGVVVGSRPTYATLLLPLALAPPRGERRRAWAALVLGLAGPVLVAAAAHRLQAGEWTTYGGARQAFYAYTGFPEVGPAPPAGPAVERGASWLVNPLPFPFDARLLLWNVAYFLVGRHVGVLPYFLPLLLGVAAFRPGAGRGALLAAVGLSALAFFVLRPFNFYGGGGAIANRYFLPLYPALWFAAARPARASWALAVAAAAAPFLWPLWSAPRAFPLRDDATFRYVAPAARLLPYETTQSHLKPGGRDDVAHRGLWVKFLDGGIVPAGEDALELRPGGRGELLVGSDRPLAALVVEGAGAAGLSAEAGGVAGRPAGTDLRLEAPRLRARHPMWWTPEPISLYHLRLRGDGGRAVRFALRGEPRS